MPKIEELLKIDNLYDVKHIETLHNIHQSLKAHYLYKKDVDYMVKGNEVIIVDEFTGRLMPGRRWSEGLHQAVEVKEKVDVKTENQTLSTITFQNYFRMYDKLAGMTGTAETEAEEFKKIYSLDVKVIPTHKPICRADHNDIIYKTEKIKYEKISECIKEHHEKGQPVLVGTVSIDKSEKLSQLLQKKQVPHKVLNAKYHEQEAEIVAQAGRKGSITIATNMAGRGTDIILGGNPEFLAGKDASKLDHFSALCEKDKQDVIQAGGLLIIGTERHESRRIDNQLRGRSGRQGDPGASRFYLSLEDDLMRIFGGERMQKVMSTLRMDEDAPITDRLLTRAIANAQKKVEAHNFEIRKHLLEYDDVMNQQRTAIYGLRRRLMKGEDLQALFFDQLSEVLSDIFDQFIDEKVKREEWNIKSFQFTLKQIFNLEFLVSDHKDSNSEDLIKLVKAQVKDAYEKQAQELGEHKDPIIQYVALHAIDSRWMEHLENIDHLREGINLRAYAQKDPLVEYKKESFHMFQQVSLNIAREIVEKFFKIQLSSKDMDLLREEETPEDFNYNEDRFVNSFSKSSPESAGQDSSLNREERRRQARRDKKQRIKI